MTKRMILRLLLAIAVFLPSMMMAQDIELKVSAPKQVVVGERFQIAFELNEEGKNFSAPSFDNFTVVGGPFSSSSSSFQMVNGSMSHTVKNTYTYALQAYKEGTFKIGSASVTVKGDKVSSTPFEIKVLPDDGSSSSGGASASQSPSSQQQSNTNDPQVSGKDLFLKVSSSKRSVYLGEQVVLSYKLYTRVPVHSLSVVKTPSYGGAWMKDISNDNGGALKQTSEYVNGIEYTVAELQRLVLVPQKTGKLVIDPMTVECIAQVQTQSGSRRSMDPFDAFFNDPFFNRNIVNVKKEISSSSLGIDVKSLPENGKPDSFAGAVGNYNFKSDVDKTELKTNEAFTLTLTVSGTGNVELLEMPKPVFPPDFEAYDPKIVTNVDPTTTGLSGTKKAEYLVIPRRAGEFSIPPVSFSFFNPTTGSYSQIQSPQYNFSVEKGEGGDSENAIYASNQEDIKYLGSDIRHINTGNPGLRQSGSSFFGSVLYFILLVALLLAFILALVLSKKRAEYKQDAAKVRNKQADRVARGRLKNALKYLKANNQNAFYVEMSQALWGYISDKMGIEQSKLSMDTVSEAMKSKEVPDDLTQQFVNTLNMCEFARFAPGDEGKKMEDLYQQGIDVITKAEKVL